MNTIIDEVCGCEMFIGLIGKMNKGDLGTGESHGMKKTAQYNRWKGMKSRCTANTVNSRYYRDRRIGVCTRWVKSFMDYYRDMGDKPFDSASMDRIDNNRGYCPHNVRWATKKEQSSNRAVVKKSKKRFALEIDGRIFASYKTIDECNSAILRIKSIEYEKTH